MDTSRWPINSFKFIHLVRQGPNEANIREMSNQLTILVSDSHQEFIKTQILSGQFVSESELVRVAINLLKQQLLFDARYQASFELRRGWDKAFKKMHKNGDDQLLIPDILED